MKDNQIQYLYEIQDVIFVLLLKLFVEGKFSHEGNEL